ncbi:MAG TPA: hypothetical protein VLB45_02240, partial [Nitrosopumilaceae archaeon]|nr:hypothetical protein [Nitrosopumilaceae archaeon]
MMRKLSMLFMIFFIGQLFVISAHGQFTKSDSPFEREFADIKFLDAYFGTFEQKVEVDAGDQNVPLTVVMANIGTQDITGIRGQLSLPSGFSPSDGKGALILADKDDNSLAGDVFSLTFFVNVDKNLDVGQYPGTIKVDYSRLRETGQRNMFFNFDFKLTGDSTLNIKAIDPILTSIKNNLVVVEVSNLGTAPISNVDI